MIGSVKVKITLPYIEWQGDDPLFTAPPMDAHVYKRLQPYMRDAPQGLGEWYYWGGIIQSQPSKHKVIRAYVNAIQLEFKDARANVTYGDYPRGRGQPENAQLRELFQSIDGWFEQVRTWVEVAVDQDADPTYPLPTAKASGIGLHVLAREGNILSIPAANNHLILTSSSDEPVSLSLMRKVIKLVNTGTVPSDAHLLLRDSRAELRRGRYRRAVIDAGSAVEITLADFNSRVTHVPTPQRGATLGWYTNQSSIKTLAKLPANINAELVKLRNDAIHQNRTPSRAEAIAALAVARIVVDALDPLPL